MRERVREKKMEREKWEEKKKKNGNSLPLEFYCICIELWIESGKKNE